MKKLALLAFAFTLYLTQSLWAQSQTNGGLWTSGYNQDGALGDGTTDSNLYYVTLPEAVVPTNVTAIAAGGYHSLFISTNGSLWGAGYDNYGELGDGSNSMAQLSYKMVQSSNVSAIAAGLYFSVFIKSDGSLWGMGDNDDGELGLPYAKSSTNIPVLIATNVASVAAGIYQTLWVTTNGQLWGVGRDYYGELGDGHNGLGYTTNVPEMIQSNGVASVSSGDGTTLFLTTNGTLYGMGYNGYGELGDGKGGFVSGNANFTNKPEMITNGVSAIASGAYHSLFIKTNGSLWGMGDNQWGQLGDGTTNNQYVPEMIVPSNVVAIACGDDHSLFIKTDGTLWAMGADHYGQLGDGHSGGGQFFGTNQPEMIANNVQAISGGTEYSMYVAPEYPPQISVSSAGAAVTNGGTNVVNVGTAQVGAPGPAVTFVISNAGLSSLTLSAPVLPSGFSVVSNLAGTVPSGSSTSFTVKLNTTSPGTNSGNITIANNDPANNPFVIAVTGVVTPAEPRIGAYNGATIITNGDTTPVNFGTQLSSTNYLSLDITLTNFGEQTLDLEGFSLPPGYVLQTNHPSALAALTRGTINIALMTTTPGTYAGTVYITNNDPTLTNGTFSFDVTGTVQPIPPTIAVYEGAALITNGELGVAIGTAQQTLTGPTVVFTITNSGQQTLNITNLALPTGFVLASAPPATIASESSANFSVQLQTGTVGSYSGQLLITNNDPSLGNNAYGFVINGTVTAPAPQIAVYEGSTNITNGQSTPISFGSVISNQTGPIMTFTVSNIGDLVLTVTNITVPPGFALLTNAQATITNLPVNFPSLSNGTFSVQLLSGTLGTASGNIAISNDTPGANPFLIPVTGTVTLPSSEHTISVAASPYYGGLASGGGTNAAGTTNTVTATPAEGYAFAGWTLAGAVVSQSTNYTFVLSNDVALVAQFVPTYAVTVTPSPTNGGNVTGAGTYEDGATATLTATPAAGFVFTAWTGQATGTNNPLVLTVTNNLNATANFASIASNSTPVTISVTVVGPGKVTPPVADKTFRSGQQVTLTATPTRGDFFVNWTGSITTNKNPLVLTPRTSIALQANFISNPFVALKGTYDGLFTNTNGVVSVATAGMLKQLTVQDTGSFSGTLLVGGASHAIGGKLDYSGANTNITVRAGEAEGTLKVAIALSSSNGVAQLTGSVAGSDWTATLDGGLASNSVAPAQFTLLLLPDTNSQPPTNSPGGDSYALITNKGANVNITGALADGATLNDATVVLPDGRVPVFDSLYSGKGLVIGWINLDLTNSAANTVTWVHPVTSSGLYEHGFTNYLAADQIELNRWTNLPANTDFGSVLTLSPVAGEDGETNAITLSTGKASGSLPNGTINPKTGLLTVNITGGDLKLTGHGAMINATNGGGYFLTKTNSQAVLISP